MSTNNLDAVLKPINPNHSIKEAGISLFLASPIIKPERFEALIHSEFKDKFQKYETANQIQLQITGTGPGAVNSLPKIYDNAGFKFIKFEEGKIAFAVQGINELQRQYISTHSLNYTSWSKFFESFIENMKIISEFNKELFVNAFSLSYIDEFKWDSKDEIDFEAVFNEKSSLLPSEFFKSKLINYQLTTTKPNKYSYWDRLDILIEQRPDTFITIIHAVIQKLNDQTVLQDLINQSSFTQMLNDAHDHNKKTLIDILTKDTCKLIKLK